MGRERELLEKAEKGQNRLCVENGGNMVEDKASE